MPSIFEKPSILGFRQEGGAVENPYARAGRTWSQPIGSVRPGKVIINPLDSVPTQGGLFQWLAENLPAGAAGIQDFVENGIISPAIYALSGYDTGESAQKERVLQEMGYGVPPSPVAAPTVPGSAAVAPAYSGPMAAVPSGRQTPLPGLGGGAVPTATSEFMNRLLKLPTSADVPSVVSTMLENARQQQPAGSRAERVAAAMKSGDFETKRTQYNQEAMRMGSPTMMDAQGNIVGRELTEPERMREFFRATGGNTMFSQTTDPAQRALQNEMMKQARGQAAANTFGTTPPERLANLQAATDARKTPQPPLSGEVREVAPGVRAATRDGQVIGFGTNQAPVKGPNGESTATMNDPLDRFMTIRGADGKERVVPNPNPRQLNMPQYVAGDKKEAEDRGFVGGSPMERGLFAAMAAAEAKKAAAAPAVAAPALPPAAFSAFDPRSRPTSAFAPRAR